MVPVVGGTGIFLNIKFYIKSYIKFHVQCTMFNVQWPTGGGGLRYHILVIFPEFGRPGVKKSKIMFFHFLYVALRAASILKNLIVL